MSVRSCCAVPGTVLFLFLAISLPSLAADKAIAPDKAVNQPAEPSGAELVRAALQAEASGKGSDRNQLLEQALAKQPDFAPARWHSGYVREGDRWLDANQAQRRAGADKRLAEYRKLRSEQAFDPQSDLILARWCRDHGLAAEARAHWSRVLDDQPQNAEALNALGVTWYDGQLLTQDQLEQLRKSQAKSKRHGGPKTTKGEKEWITFWDTQLAAWRRALDRDQSPPGASLRAALESNNDSLAVQVLGTLLVTRSQGPQDRKFYQEVSLGMVRRLEYRDEFWTSAQLVRQALDHPSDEVRTAATDALKKKPREEYVPLFLQRLRLPIEARAAIVDLGLGGVIYQYSLECEGLDAVYVEDRAVHHHVPSGNGWTDVDPLFFVAAGETGAHLTAAQEQAKANAASSLDEKRAMVARRSLRAHRNAAAELTAVQRRVEATNAETADLNQRTQYALSRATGAQVNDDPVAWMKWWRDYCYDYYEVECPTDTNSPGKKPVRQNTSWGYRNYAISCFPWNTKVWTAAGPVNIDQIKPGDRVLSQHPRSGELAYQPVLQVTKRKPSPMMKIQVGNDTLLTTRGHPFWVCGQGWKMTKQLQAGMWLHAVSGPVVVERVEQAPTAGPWYEQLQQRPDAKPEDVLSYNLVVDEFHNYFVGERRLLVHDNVLFVLDGQVPPVPGLATR